MHLRSATKGFTLLEGLFAIFIVFLVLTGLSSTLGQAAQVKKNTQNMDQAIEEFHTLLTLKNDILAAVSIEIPAKGASSANFVSRQVNPQLGFMERIDVIGDPLDPYEDEEQIGVEYKIDEGILKRYWQPQGGTLYAERLLRAEELNFSLSSGSSPLMTIELSVKGTRITKKRSLKVAVMAP